MATFEAVINDCYGGFCLSEKGRQRYLELNPEYAKSLKEPKYFDDTNLSRTDPILIKVVKELGREVDEKAKSIFRDEDGFYSSKLTIVQIPMDMADIAYIHEYDGLEDVCYDTTRKLLKKAVMQLPDGETKTEIQDYLFQKHGYLSP